MSTGPVIRVADVLIVEDDAIISSHLTQTIEQAGHRVAGTACSGLEALAKATLLRPDIVLMDIGLAGEMDGVEAATRMRDRLAIPVVYLTGTTDARTIHRAVASHPFGYLQKPVNEIEVQCAIEVALVRHRSESALFRRQKALLDYALGLRHESHVDELTGLHNRRGFMQLASHHMKAVARHFHPWMLIFIDVNGLKRVNDTYGHGSGDALLTDFARILSQTFRQSDILARMGGDEFVVLALESAATGERCVKERLQERLKEHNKDVDDGRALTVSIGVAVPDPDSPESIEALISRADAAMYEEKRRVHAAEARRGA